MATVAVLVGVLVYTNSDSDDSSKKNKDYHQYTIYESDDKEDIQAKSESASDALDIIFGEDRTPLAGSIEEAKESVEIDTTKPASEEIKETPVEVTTLSDEKTNSSKTNEVKKSSGNKSYTRPTVANKASTKAAVAKSVLESVDQKAIANAYATVKVAEIQAKSNVAVAVTDYAVKTIATEKTKRIKEVNKTISDATDAAKAISKATNDITKSSDEISDVLDALKKLK